VDIPGVAYWSRGKDEGVQYVTSRIVTKSQWDKVKAGEKRIERRPYVVEKKKKP